MDTLDGPRLAPSSGGKATSLVVLLHGYGADGRDLIELGRQWAPFFPDTAFVAPHAPEPCDMAPGMRQWFPLDLRDPHEYRRGAAGAAPVLDAFLDAELARAGLPAGRMAVVGFSQGTMMALQVGLRRKEPLAGIVGYSGRLAGVDAIADEARSRPPVLLVHGDLDEVIPVGALHETANALASAGVPVEWHVRPGLGHAIDAEGLALGAAFLHRVLAAPTI